LSLEFLRKLFKTENQKEAIIPGPLEVKVQGGGERQASQVLEGIRKDHLARYELAAEYLKKGDHVLDMACGVGYGSFILANNTKTKKVTAVDLSRDAIAYAEKYYNSPKIDYSLSDCLTVQLADGFYDLIVSFETIEHVSAPELLLERFSKTLKPGGLLILSTPSQITQPFSRDRFPFHVKHFTPTEICDLVKRYNFFLEEVSSQPDNSTRDLVQGWDGLFNILVCKKNN